MDLAYAVADMPVANSKVSADAQEVTAGGPATNAATTFAFLGGHAALTTAVGQSALALAIKEELEEFHVRLYDIAEKRNEPPPVSCIFVLPGGTRSIVSANARAFSALEFRTDTGWLDQVDIVLVDGHYMPLCTEAAKAARSRDIPVIFDGGSWKAGTDDLLRNVDTVICSNDFHPPGCRNAEDVLAYLNGFGISRIAITRGAESVLYTDTGEQAEMQLPKVDAVDTSGAGDIFHGAFCYGYARGSDFSAALTFAAEVATYACKYVGTRRWMQEFPGPKREART